MKKLLVALCFTCALVLAVQAEDTKSGKKKHEQTAEQKTLKKDMLAKYDTNKDGKLDDAERATMRDAKVTERFKKMDANGDGKLTLDEFKAAAAKKGDFHRHGRHGHGHLRNKAAAPGVK